MIAFIRPIHGTLQQVLFWRDDALDTFQRELSKGELPLTPIMMSVTYTVTSSSDRLWPTMVSFPYVTDKFDGDIPLDLILLKGHADF